MRNSIPKILFVAVLVMTASFSRSGQEIMRKGPYLLPTGASQSMTVLWETHKPPAGGSCSIEWGSSPAEKEGAAVVRGDGASRDGRSFSFRIDGRKPGRVTSYRVICDGQRYDGSFRTPAGDAPAVTFYGIGDTRANGADRGRYADVVKALLDDAAKAPEDRAMSLIIHAGDFVQYGMSEQGWDREFFFRNDTNNRLLATMPIAGVAGNHEGYTEGRGFDYSNFGALFRRYFPYPAYGGGPDRFYYAFDYGPVRFVFIDANNREPRDSERKYVEGGLNITAAGMKAGTEQFEWLRKVLERPGGWKVVVLHDPLWSASPLRDRFRDHTGLRGGLHDLFRKSGVRIVMQGHHHFYARCEVDGITYLTLGGGGAVLSKVHEKEPFVKAAKRVHHFARFDVSPGRMTVSVIDVDGNPVEPPFTRAFSPSPQAPPRSEP